MCQRDTSLFNLNIYSVKIKVVTYMGNIFTDIISFIKSLSFVDIVFMMSIIGLIILIVTLVYIIKVNDEEEVDTKEKVEVFNYEKKEELTVPQVPAPRKEIIEDELDLSKITKELDQTNPKVIALNEYEREQEERAIISYDELLKTKDLQEEINYINEKNLGDLTVKSVDVESVTRPIELPKIKAKLQETEEEKEEVKPIIKPIEDDSPRHSKTILISYTKEEEFLQALKTLEGLLN